MNLDLEPEPERAERELTPEGLEWLRRPIAIPAQQKAIFMLAEDFAVGFDLTHAEALAAIAAATSLAVGPSVKVASGRGPALPLSIQLAVVAGINPNFDRCITALCQAVIDTAAEVFGKGDMENDLAARLAEAEQRYAASALLFKQAKNRGRRAGAQRQELSIQELQGANAADHLQYLRLVRKASLFPFVNHIAPVTVRTLALEDYDNALGSFSPDGGALSRLLDAPRQEKGEVTDFLQAGFRGGMLNLTANPTWTVLPVATAVWLCPPDLIAKGFSERIFTELPEFLVAAPSAPPDDSLPPLSAAGPLNLWAFFVRAILTRLRFQFYRRNSEERNEIVRDLDRLATQALIPAQSWRNQFAAHPGFVQDLLSDAPDQILKLAALLSMDSDAPVNEATVVAASEIYRWLVRGTLDAEASRHQWSASREVDRLADKLGSHGPLGLRDLVRTYDRQDYTRVRGILDTAIAAGRVVENGGIFSVVR